MLDLEATKTDDFATRMCATGNERNGTLCNATDQNIRRTACRTCYDCAAGAFVARGRSTSVTPTTPGAMSFTGELRFGLQMGRQGSHDAGIGL